MTHKKRCSGERKHKYGFSAAYRDGLKRAAGYTREDWAAIIKRGGDIYTHIASLMEKGPEDPQVQKALADWRQYITESFFNCTTEIFRGLADLYLKDKRFIENIDKTRPGLAKFLGDAIKLYCSRLIDG